MIDADWIKLAERALTDYSFRRLLVMEADDFEELRKFCATPESFETIVSLIRADHILKRVLKKFKAGYSETDIYMFLYDLGDE